MFQCYNISLLQYFNASMFQCSNVPAALQWWELCFYWNTAPVILLHVFLLQFSPFIVSILVLLYRSDHTYTANNEWEKISISFPIHYSQTGLLYENVLRIVWSLWNVISFPTQCRVCVYVWVQLGESQTLNQMQNFSNQMQNVPNRRKLILISPKLCILSTWTVAGKHIELLLRENKIFFP